MSDVKTPVTPDKSRWDVWLRQDTKMSSIALDVKHFMVITVNDDPNKVQVRVNHEIDDETSKRMYYAIEENLRMRGILPPMPSPEPIREPEGDKVLAAPETTHEAKENK